ncbi:MAG: hypothetical protein ACRDUW_25685 [Pseudonocardiaceae bacterium]
MTRTRAAGRLCGPSRMTMRSLRVKAHELSRPLLALTIDQSATMGRVVGRYHPRGGLIEMVKHGDKSTDNGQGNYDPAKSKDVKDAGGGRHSSEDKGDKDNQDPDKGDKK